MEVYRNETREIQNCYLGLQITLADCIVALDAALARFIPRLHHDELDALKAQLLANHELVIAEVERRTIALAEPPTTLPQ